MDTVTFGDAVVFGVIGACILAAVYHVMPYLFEALGWVLYQCGRIRGTK